MDRVDDLARVDALKVNRRDPQVSMPELPLDNRQRDNFVRHPDGMGMPELVRRETAPHTGLGGEPPKLTPGSGRPSTPASRPVTADGR